MARGSFRFQRRLRIMPGLTLNFSKSGISTSLGARGAHVTFSKRGVRKTFGIPGTGISYTTFTPHRGGTTASSAPPAGYVNRGLRLRHLLLLWLAAFIWVAIEIPDSSSTKALAIGTLAWALFAILLGWPIYRIVQHSLALRSIRQLPSAGTGSPDSN
jgi:hypothetical protein